MLPLHEGLVYGPVRSRRLGHSLGINILPRGIKVCTFNCTYCQYGWTPQAGVPTSARWPSAAEVARAVEQVLRRLTAHGDAIDRLTISGNGEPTLHPAFGEVVDALCEARDGAAPGVPLAVLSNASTLDTPGVAGALDRVDERHMKLDAGETALLRRVNAGTVSFEQVLAGLKALREPIIQSAFVRDRMGRIDNTGDLSVANWIAALRAIAPRAVHIYTIDRAPAWPYLQAVPAPRLEEIGRRAGEAGLAAMVFAPAAPAPARAVVAPRTARPAAAEGRAASR